MIQILALQELDSESETDFLCLSVVESTATAWTL
jgi:hypothetical protein